MNTHSHDDVEHTHCYGAYEHAHLEGSKCLWAECKEYPAHNFHTSTGRETQPV